MLRHLVIEERHGGIFRIANGSGTIDVTGETLEEALVNAANTAYGFVSQQTVNLLSDLLGKREETSWHKTPVVNG